MIVRFDEASTLLDTISLDIRAMICNYVLTVLHSYNKSNRVALLFWRNSRSITWGGRSNTCDGAGVELPENLHHPHSVRNRW